MIKNRFDMTNMIYPHVCVIKIDEIWKDMDYVSFSQSAMNMMIPIPHS